MTTEGDFPPFVTGAAAFLDWALDTAQKHGMQVIVDLHGAPGMSPHILLVYSL